VVDQFNQAILNIIVNASHAIAEVIGDREPEKGRITISTRRDGEAVEIKIADTGGGIPEEIRNRVFEPFFSTKQVGKGTGQGLALAHSAIVKEHDGKIWFESERGRGTTFYIRLPLGVAAAAAAAK
jgi:signal transduction histidine kinase